MQTRRQFVVRAGTAAASAILSPSALAAGLGSARPAALARGGRFSEGVMSGEPTPSAHHAVDAPGRRRGQGHASISRWQPTRTSATSWPTSGCRPPRPSTTTSSRGSPASRPTSSTTTASRRATKDGPGRALPHGAAGRLPAAGALRLLVLPGLHARLLQRARGADRAGPRLRRLPGRLHLRRDLPHGQGRHGRPRRQDRPRRHGHRSGRVDYTRAAETLQDYREKYSLYRSDEIAAQGSSSSFPIVIAVGRPRGAGQLRGRRARRRAAAQPALLQEAPGRRLQGLLREHAVLAAGKGGHDRIYRRLQFGSTVDLIVMDQRQYRENQPCDDTVAPACADWNQPRDFLGPHADQLGQGRSSAPPRPPGRSWPTRSRSCRPRSSASTFFGFDSWQGYPQEREELLVHIDDHQHQGRRLRHRRHPHVHRRRRAQRDIDGNGDTVAIEFVGGSITSQGLGETDLTPATA